MNFSGRTSFTTEETDDALLFFLVREPGAIERIGLPLFAAIILWSLWQSGSFAFQCFAVFALISGSAAYVASWLHGKQSILRITANEIIASGNLARTFTTEVRIPSNEIRSLKWDSGGEDGTPGLYANCGWNATLLLPYIDEAQAAIIRDAVARRFSELQIGDDYNASFLYGNDSGVTTLGLNNSTDEAAQAKS
jgi:hypothetical protein